MFQSASRVTGDEPVGGAGGEVAAAGQVGVVAGASGVGCAQRVSLVGPVLEFGLDGEGGFDGERGEGLDEQRADAFAGAVTRDRGADPVPVGDAVALADVGGQILVAALVVADGHAAAAAAADDDALQQCRSFPGRSGDAVTAVGGGVGGQAVAVGVVLAQGDVSGVDAGDEGDPFFAGQQPRRHFPAGLLVVTVPAIGEAAGIARVVQDPQHGVMLQRFPVDLPFAGPLQMPPGETQAGGVERLDACRRGPGRLEGGEQVGERAADGGVGAGDDVAGGVVDQPDRQRGDELAAAGLGQDPAAQPGPDEMELSFLCPFMPKSRRSLKFRGS